ncbi:conserved hypothetical protein [Methylocella silvestris BL2]|uniref:DUF3489 domain-containing protein n=1 Tax=Methylocella silvestris (strain DSM 15510 / CIP 108128 / LMG 27833 / NCIMB 13906 / BL2) TaxID=395965 RepID=B8ERF8_METSB|nr:DUF3489 domain-containing protein [Methylocella silvestris]ACK51010.1 conserved hypothetical protein [Methylocella silvestris BL2]
MSHSKSKPNTASPKAVRAPAVSAIAPIDVKDEAAALVSPSLKPTACAGTKQDAVVAMLRRPQGATLAAIMTATGWQQHSVRGFLAAVVRKKLGLRFASDKTGDARTYRVVAQDSAPPRKEKTRRKAA